LVSRYRSGERQNLGAGIRNVDYVTTLWTEDENSFILVDTLFANTVYPIRLFTLTAGQIGYDLVGDIPAIVKNWGVGFRYAGFRVVGFSPDGRYLLIVWEDNSLYAVDLRDEQTVDWGMRYRAVSPVVWLDASSFIGVTERGVIQYNLTNQRLTEMLPRAAINMNTLNHQSLSPTGEYMIAIGISENLGLIVACDTGL
jgi:hypothetical protein